MGSGMLLMQYHVMVILIEALPRHGKSFASPSTTSTVIKVVSTSQTNL